MAVLCGWVGNHRSGVALAMHHRLCGITTYRLSGLRKEDEHPPVYSCKEYGTSLYHN